MGNSISGFLADFVMKDLETEALKKLPFNTPFYKRYVCDIIVAIPICETETILNRFFTVEEEIDGSLNFLDMSLKRMNDGSISTKWYQKETASGRYLHFQAHNPIQHKRNVATTITDRAIALTNPDDRSEKLQKVRNLLSNNGYPAPFVANVIQKRVDRNYNGPNAKETKVAKYNPTPYIPGLSEKLKKTLNGYDLTLSCKATNKIGNVYTRTKYKIPKDHKSKVVYMVTCSTCNVTYSRTEWRNTGAI